MDGTYKKSKGNVGLEGVQFQLDLLIVFLFKALQGYTNWKISTENQQAGKYDDLVFELPDKSIYLQAKFKQNKKINRDQLLSNNSKNADFSLPKYFFSYLQIKSEFKEKAVIICTNTDINKKGLENSLILHRVSPDDMLYCEETSCPYFTLNTNILKDLKESAESYLDKNLQGKGFDKTVITNENIEEFLKNLQFFYKYPSGDELHKVIEQLLSRFSYSCLWYKTSYHDIFRKVEQWFKQPKGEYLTEFRIKSMLCEIRSDKYCETLKYYDISFDQNNFNFSDCSRIFLVKVQEGCLLQTLKIFNALQSDKTKKLFVNPDDDIEVQMLAMEVFKVGQYEFLIINCSRIRNAIVEAEKLKELLEKDLYKKIILISEDNSKLAQHIGLKDIVRINESVTFENLSKRSQERLLRNRNIVFQGETISLEELLETRVNEDYRKSLNAEILEQLIRGENIKIGKRLLYLDENVAQCYIRRNFVREINGTWEEKNIIFEENLFHLTDKVVLISENAGMGKTTVMTKIASHIKQQHSNIWVIKINLSDYTRILKDCLKKKRDTISVTELLNSQKITKLTNPFEEYVFSMNKKVVLLLDAVDEISPTYTHLIFHLLAQCQTAANIAKIFTTTRTYMARELKMFLNVGSFKMLPFTKQNQIDFLTSYWVHNLQLPDANKKRRKCEQYAETLITKMSAWTQSYANEENPLAAVPLQVRMMAEIFQETNLSEQIHWEGCKEYVCGDDNEPKLPEKCNITKLYDMFIEKKRDVFLDKGNPTGNTAADQALIDQFEECLAHHRNLALKVILAENEHHLFSNSHGCDSGYVFKIGIVQTCDEKLIFMHRTFAEYFVAASILQELQQNPSIEFQKFLIDVILIKNEFKVIRAFFDSFLEKAIDSLPSDIFKKYQFNTCGTKLNLIFDLAEEGWVTILQLILKSINFKIIKNKKIDIKNWQIRPQQWKTNTLNLLQIFVQQAGVNIREVCGKTPLHFAIRGGHLEMVKFLVKQGADVNVGDEKGKTVLHFAAEKGDLSSVKYLVEIGADVNIEDYDNHTALYFAINWGHLTVVKYLVEHVTNINVRDSNGRTALHLAAKSGHLNTVKFLVERGVNVNIGDDDHNTALHWAAKMSELNTVRYLVKHGVNINGIDDEGRTPLHLASRYGEFSVVSCLVEHGSDINIKDNEGCTALHLAAERSHLIIIKFLVEHGANINDKDNKSCIALHLAARWGTLDVVNFLVKDGANFNIQNCKGWTALHFAADAGKLAMVKNLVEIGVNVDIKDNDGRTALHLAAKGGTINVVKYFLDVNDEEYDNHITLYCAINWNYLNVLKYLMEYVEDINIRDNNGCTALHLAAKAADLTSVKCLMESGVDVNVKDNDHRTALHWAAATGNLNTVKYLVQHGVNINDRDEKGYTPLHLAARYQLLEVVNVLVEHGSDVNITNNDGGTALHVAAERGDLNIVKYLMECFVNVNSRDNKGYTALHLAADYGNLDIVNYLVECGSDLDIKANDGRMALHLAAAKADLDIVKCLVECKLNVNDRDNKGLSPLHLAAGYGILDIVNYLVQHGSDINIKDYTDRIALHWAAENDSITIVKYFVERGVNVNHKDDKWHTPLHLAAERSNLSTIKYLIKYSANINDIDKKGQTPLHLAAERSSLNAVKYLVQSGANINARDGNGQTPLHLAACYGVLNIVNYLVKCGSDVNIRDNDSRTVLNWAAEKGKLGIVKYFEKHAADVGTKHNGKC